ncbi:relaxase/mobilization nuclease domain-containing protein [Pseudobutyrivibrio ruminis]|uniref:relaxase/mobilization nuclease domain-containing protein n=1 Tax=Pseudobutyrivibrio ruminis TaxID=46206 RepID=UPI00051C9F80|nr:relaxase/mobilization nuclease domain-containing protein [Pseudobutyrivibrio ruminis]
MTAICKTIAVHGEHLSSLLDYGADIEKTSLSNEALSNLFTYAKNESKTSFVNPLNEEKSLLVTGVKCSPESANEEFKAVRDTYPSSKRGLGKRQEPVIAIHLIQSFSETNISPIVAHKIGIELLERNGYMGVVDTHMNKSHIHNHIIINSYIPNIEKKIILEKSFLMAIRKLSDEIQQEYGIPIEFDAPRKQLEKSKDSMTYGEWAAQRKNTSWKADLFESMLISSASASDKTEYISLMGRFGYHLAKEKANGDLVWFNLDHSKKIKESTLYREFTDSNLRQFNHSYIHFDYLEQGYSWDGRELNDIENLLRGTYNTVCLMANYISSEHSKHRLKAYNLDFKKSELYWANNIKQLYSVDSIREVNDKLTSVGTSLSIVKKQIKDLDCIRGYFSTIADYSSAVQLLKQSVLDNGGSQDLLNNLFLPDFNYIDQQENNAKISPLSSAQKRNLHILMNKHPDYRLSNAKKGYSNLSTVDYYNISNYFKYGGDIPSSLCTKDSFNHNMAYENQYSYLRKRFPFPANSRQIKECKELLVNAGVDIAKLDFKELTLADVINIQNCLGPIPTLNSIHDPVLPSPNDIQKCIDICKQTGLVPPINPKDMSSKQCNLFYSWACSQGNKPKFIERPTTINHDVAFNESINKLSPEIQKSLIAYRDAVIRLHKIGLSVDEVETYIKHFVDIDDKYNSLKHNQTNLSKQYKDLIHLKQILNFTQDVHYVYGSHELRSQFIEYEKSKIDSDMANKNIDKQKIFDQKDKEIDFDF